MNQQPRRSSSGKAVLLLMALLALTLLVSACAPAAPKATDAPPAPAADAAPQVPTVQEGKLIVGMELAYPPFEGKNEQGEPTGIAPDFVRDLAKALNKELVIENIAWDGLIPALMTGKVDMVMSSMTITDARKEKVDFSIPYANAYLALLTNTKSNIASVEDLNQPGKTIAVKTGSTGYFYAQKHLNQATVLSFPDESACVTEVSQGKADAFIYDQLTIYRNWKRHEDTTTPVFIPFQDVENWGIAFQKGTDTLQQATNDFIAQYAKDGGFEALTQKHLKEEKQVFDELQFKWFFDLDAAATK